MRANKFQVNNLFFNGYFKLNKKRKPTAAFIKSTLTDNPFNISFRKNTFTLQVSKNINDFLIEGNLSQILRNKIEDILEEKGKVDEISAHLLNYHASLTLFFCDKNYFVDQILTEFCIRFQIPEVQISQEASLSTETKVPIRELVYLRNNFTYLQIEIENKFYQQNNITMKFQFNQTEKQVHVSLIATYFDHFVRRIFDAWDNWGNAFKNKIQSSSRFVTDRSRRLRVQPSG